MTRNNIIILATLNLLFWVAIYFIGLGFDFTWERPPFSTVDNTYAPTFWWGTLINMLIVYGNSFWLFPIKKRKNWGIQYWLLAGVMVLLLTVVEAIGDFWLIEKMSLLQSVYDDIFEQVVPNWVIIFGLTLEHIFINIFFIFLSFLNIFYIEATKDSQIKLALQEEKLKSELKFLKAQINPHFLFNGINSVYHLIDQKPNVAKDTLLKFSNLLRYQLYECNDDIIPLEKELQHIRDYVEMEKIRKGEDATINLQLPEETLQVKIPPILFTPFLENAFKYVSNHDEGEQNQIEISIKLQPERNKLYFEIQNTIDQNQPTSDGEIGIQNVKKRLSLLFPKQHDLAIFAEQERFLVKMVLDLSKFNQKTL